MRIEVAHKTIGDDCPTFIIAEIGQNHQGDAYTASRLIQQAEKCGVDAVKLCKRHLPSEMTAEAAARPYDNEHSFGATYGEHRAALELSIEEYRHLKQRHEYNGNTALFFSTACDIQSVNELEAIDVPMYKVASRDLDNIPLLERIAETGKPVILSSGMGTLAEIREALDTIRRKHDKVILLHCTSEYPTPLEHVNLRAMETLRREFGCLVGLSDHTSGIKTAVAASVLGACIIEKHFTMSRSMKGRDHAASLEPKGMAMLVEWVRQIESAMGDGVKKYEPWMHEPRARLGRSLVAARDIQPGEVITEDMVCLKSPGTGLCWRRRAEMFGRKATEPIPVDTVIRNDQLSPAAPVSFFPADICEAMQNAK